MATVTDATGHSFHLSHTSLANLNLKIAWGMDSVSDSHKGQALSVLICICLGREIGISGFGD